MRLIRGVFVAKSPQSAPLEPAVSSLPLPRPPGPRSIAPDPEVLSSRAASRTLRAPCPASPARPDSHAHGRRRRHGRARRRPRPQRRRGRGRARAPHPDLLLHHHHQLGPRQFGPGLEPGRRAELGHAGGDPQQQRHRRRGQHREPTGHVHTVDVLGLYGLLGQADALGDLQAPGAAHPGRPDQRGPVRPRHPRPRHRRRPATAAGVRRLRRPRLQRLAAGDERGPGHDAAHAAGLGQPDHAHPHPHRGRPVGQPLDGREFRRPLRLRAARRRRRLGLPAHRLRADERRLRLRDPGRPHRVPDGHLRADQLELRHDRRLGRPDRLRRDQHAAEPADLLGAPGRQAGRRRRPRPRGAVRARHAAADTARPTPPEGALPPGARALPGDPRAGARPRRPRRAATPSGVRRGAANRAESGCADRGTAEGRTGPGARGAAHGQGDAVQAHPPGRGRGDGVGRRRVGCGGCGRRFGAGRGRD